MNRCEDCYFYERIDDLRGRCHRYPPKMTTRRDKNLSLEQDKTEGQFPVVDAKAWCGEWD